ncbi:hypothetical protein ACJMK2_029803 [Sinanodonta woodiana]|uniref:Peptidyl-prolyl cis-trans isomerase n=1 Tax=Sinanodonta woodiana TaxID=1069815 RepID=A0ABD3XBT5_SINWO
MAVLLETSVGDITIDLYTEERPKCCQNFLKLCKVKYYNFSLFHSIQRNLVAQTGDPTGTGRGGASIFHQLYGDQARYFECEMTPRIKHTKTGMVSMVNNGNNMHGSQFFITLGENLDYLNGVHTVFGEVTEGHDVLKKINEAYCDKEHRPYQDIRIYHTIVLDDPFDDPDGLQVPDRSPEPTKEQLDSGRIGADEDIDEFKGKSEEEMKEILEEREASANAKLLTMVGDIPDEDIAPPDEVLFVCKLNPVTTDEDLEIIFSRFGPIKSCEVIRDQKTGESLQYAFIEFEKAEDCEKAFFKMDNVLIDDRRIHVDFSQSVSKLKWKKGDKGVPDAKEKGKEEDDSLIGSKYAIKDRSRKNDGYELVFEEEEESEEEPAKKKKKKKQKYKEHKQKSSDSDSKRKPSTSEKKHKKERSSSPKARKEKRQQRSISSSSPSPPRQKEHQEKYRKKSRSRSPVRKDSRRSRSPLDRDYKMDKRDRYSEEMEEDRQHLNKDKSTSSRYKDSKEKHRKRSMSPVRKDHRQRSRSPSERDYKASKREKQSGDRNEDRYGYSGKGRSPSAGYKDYKDKYRQRSRSR